MIELGDVGFIAIDLADQTLEQLALGKLIEDLVILPTQIITIVWMHPEAIVD